MSCNCKKTVDKINEKYGDGGNKKRNMNPLLKLVQFIMQIIVGLVCGVIIAVLLVPMMIYVIICMMFGKQIRFRIKNPNKYLKKK